MSVSSLNIEIAARIGNFQRSIATVERDLQRFASKMNRIGDTISQSISLPLLALGVSAVKAAGDMEELRLALTATMTDAGYSISDAKDELELLRKSALAPGLDLEQAVRASIRLQNVGFSAANARKTIEELANAIAMGGGSADDLNEIVNQFSQMIGKNKILNEDLKIVMARMPKMASLMQTAFGTVDLDKIRQSGISAKEFVEKVTQAASGLGRVQGGIKNSIVNAFSAIKQAAAGLGDELNRVFDFNKISNDFAASVGNMVAWFKSLDDSTKKMIVEFGVFLVALGPAAKVIAGVASVMQSLKVAQGILVDGYKKLATGVLSAVEAFKKMDTATKLTVIGLALAAVTALYFAYKSWSEEMSAAQIAQQGVQNVTVKAQQSIVEQKMHIDKLVATIKSENATYDQKKAALDELQKIQPEYYKGLSLEKDIINQITAAQQKGNQALYDKALAVAAQERLVELAKEELDTTKTLEQASTSYWQKTQSALMHTAKLALGGGLVGMFDKSFAEVDAEKVQQNIKKINEARGLEKESLTDIILKYEQANGAIETNTAVTDNNTRSVTTHTDKLNAFQKATKELGAAMTMQFLTGQIDEQAQIDKTLDKIQDLVKDGYKVEGKEIQELLKYIEKLKKARKEVNDNYKPNTSGNPSNPNGPVQPLPGAGPVNVVSQTAGETPTISPDFAQKATDWTKDHTKAIDEWAKKVQEAKVIAEDFFKKNGEGAKGLMTLSEQLAEVTSNTLGDASKSWADYGKAVISAISDAIGAMIKQYVAAMLVKVATNLGLGPIASLALSGLVGGLASGLFKRLVGSIAMADGGIVSGPTHALVGEYPGARSNPEVVAPLSKLKSMIGGGAPASMQVYGMIRGNDIYISSEKSKTIFNRINGNG